MYFRVQKIFFILCNNSCDNFQLFNQKYSKYFFSILEIIFNKFKPYSDTNCRTGPFPLIYLLL